MKISGEELLKFMEEAWPGDEWFWDHEEFEDPVPGVTYDTDAIGGLFWQGVGPDPTDRNGLDLAKLIREWRKTRTTDFYFVSVPKTEAFSFEETMRSNGWKAKKT